MKKFTFWLFCLLSSAIFAQISPSEGAAFEHLNITITGTESNYQSGGAAFRCTYYDQASNLNVVNASNVSTSSNTSMAGFILLPNVIGQLGVQTYDDVDGWVTLPSKFLMINPQFSSNIVKAAQGQNLSISLTGQNTAFTKGVSSVKLYKIATQTTYINATNVSVVNDYEVTADLTIPSNAPFGLYHLQVTYAGKTLEKYNYFEISNASSAFALYALSTNPFTEGKNCSFSLYGNQFMSPLDSLILKKGDAKIKASSLNYVNSSNATAEIKIPNYTFGGPYDLHLYQGKDSALLSGIYIKNDPSNDPKFASLNSNSGHKGDSLEITLTGDYFSRFSSGSNSFMLYQLGTNTSQLEFTPINVLNDSSMNVSLYIPPTALAGDYSIQVSNSNFPSYTVNKAFYVYPNTIGIGSISGSISDELGIPPHPYTILLVDANTYEKIQVTVSDSYGDFVFYDVSEGKYLLYVEAAYSPLSPTVISMDPNGNTNQVVEVSVNSSVIYVTETSKAPSISTRVYPNPFDQNIQVSNTDFQYYEVLSLEGKVLQSEKLKPVLSTNINTAHLSKGCYLLKLYGNNSVEVHKILKK